MQQPIPDQPYDAKVALRRRASTAVTLCPPPELLNLNHMEIEESDNSIKPVESVCRSHSYCSPNPALHSKKRLHFFHLDETFLSINRYHSSGCKRLKADIEAEIFFDFTLQKASSFHHVDFLEIHEISEKHRAKMMDWMIEVLNLSKQKEDTIFRAFLVMDSYFAACPSSIPTDRLHLIGCVAMLIASKLDEVSPISLQSLLSTICRDKFTKEEVLAMEFEILSKIQFRTHCPTIKEISSCAFNLIRLDNPEVRQFFQKGSLLISKMCLFSYEIVNKFTFREITAFSIILSLKLVESFKQGFTSQDKVS
jgi:hypothetical protein